MHSAQSTSHVYNTIDRGVPWRQAELFPRSIMHTRYGTLHSFPLQGVLAVDTTEVQRLGARW